MANLLEMHGARPNKEPKFVPLFIDRAFTGLFSQRHPLHDPSDTVEKYYGGRPDSIWMGKNVELTNKLTIQRRPGLSAFSSVTYPTAPNDVFSFELSNATIQVVVDTGSTGNVSLASVDASGGGVAVYYYASTQSAGASNAYVGMIFVVSGFSIVSNNGTFVCTASSSSSLTLQNAFAQAETIAATTISYGAVYVDNQNGTKTFLLGKSAGAGPTRFIAVGGILYMGDGVDTKKYTPLNSNGTIWNWGIVAPAAQPAVTIVASGNAAVQWAASTVWSTMGLISDSSTQTVHELISVNATGTNTTQFGVSGNGSPAWNQTPGGTTSDGSGTWVNKGPIVLWTAHTFYTNDQIGGTSNTPCIIYDPATKSCYVKSAVSGVASSGGVYPSFKPGKGQQTQDGGVVWFWLGPANNGIPFTWTQNKAFTPIGASGAYDDSYAGVSEPVSLANGLPTNQIVYWQVASSAFTTSSSFSAPKWSTTVGQLTGGDGDLIWLCLGSYVWAASTNYSGWTANGSIFSVVQDPHNNFQVCTKTGTSATVKPGTSFTLSAAGNASGGNTTYTGTFSPVIPVGNGSMSVVISGFSTAANNGTFTVVSCSATQLVVKNASGVSESIAATAIFNPWAVGYGAVTADGTTVWTCVGASMQWAVSTKWFLPTTGFSPPSSSSPYGGASVIDSNSYVEFVINSGLGGATAPTWGALGTNTADGGTPLTLTQVTVSGTTATYTGTITGGAANAFVGRVYLVAGFATVGNNVLITVTASTATTLVCTTSSQVNETLAGTATTGAIWYNVTASSPNSLIWSSGHVYAYSFKARPLTDYYSVTINGALPVPPGLGNALPSPIGSETNAISTASPVFTITGSNSGAVNTISGFGSTDPQVDTIVIWRDADGGGASQMFELTEIPAPQSIGGIAQPWVFKDFLPDVATSDFPGLDILSPAPINHENDPPPSVYLPMVYNFQRIWGANGQQVNSSGGPDILTGNPDEAFNPSDDLPFLSSVIRLVRTSQGILTFLSNSIDFIAGGPETVSFFSMTIAPGIGLIGYNALDIFAGEIYFFAADNSYRVISPTLNISTLGFPIGDQLANAPISGVSDTIWNPATAYLTFHQSGVDSALYLADGSTGWYRCNPRQVPGGVHGAEAVWSPFAAITNGCKMVRSIETAPGVKKLLVGSTTGGNQILKRDTTLFTDNSTQYDAWLTIGSIMLANPGQLAALKFIESDFSGVSFRPTISFLLNEISGTFTPFTLAPVFDPPVIYGETIIPSSYSPNRYYFSGTQAVAKCRHMQIKVDFGTTSTGDEMTNLCIFGRLFVEV